MTALDSIDRNILRLLRLDARMSNAKLAAEIGLSPSACLRPFPTKLKIIPGFDRRQGSTPQRSATSVFAWATRAKQRRP